MLRAESIVNFKLVRKQPQKTEIDSWERVRCLYFLNNINIDMKENFMVLVDNKYEYDIIVLTNKSVVEDISENDDIIVDISENDDIIVYELYASNDDIWSDHVKGKKLITIVNDDFEYEIHNHESDNNINFDASKIQELRILLNFIAKDYDIGIKIIDTKLTYNFGKLE